MTSRTALAATVERERVELVVGLHARIEALDAHVAAVALEAFTEQLQIALELGDALVRVRATKAYGEWLPWVDDNLPFSRVRSAEYIRLAEARASGELDVENVRPGVHLGVKAALRLISTAPAPQLDGGHDGKRATSAAWLPPSFFDAPATRKWTDVQSSAQKAIDALGEIKDVAPPSAADALRDAQRAFKRAANLCAELAEQAEAIA